MDAYQTLGVPWNCTREEAKEAFLARVSSAHPDHGGEDLAFIRLRTAYEQILEEIDRRPDADRLQSKRNMKPPDPAVSREAYIAMLARASKFERKRWKWVGKLGAIFLLYLIFWIPSVFLWGGIVQAFELDQAADHHELSPYIFYFLFVAVNLTALLPGCFLVWKYNLD